MYAKGAKVRDPDGTSRWVSWSSPLNDIVDFDEVGAGFEATGGVVEGVVGDARSRLMSQRALVDFATAWIAERR